MGFSVEFVLLAGSLMILLSIMVSKMSSHFSIPILAVFLFVGMMAGSEGIGQIHFDNVEFAKGLGIVALSFILFAGGLDTNFRRTRLVMWPSFVLATAGVFISAGVAGLLIHFILGRELWESLLLGSVISSTDAAAVFSILRSRSVKLKGLLKPLLEIESASNDPSAVFLTIIVIQIIMMPSVDFKSVVIMFFQQLFWGVVVGIALSRVMEFIIRRMDLQYEGLYPVLTMSFVMFTYSMTALIGGNGFLAVFLMGLSLSRFDLRRKANLITFHDSIAWLMQAVMFLTLGLLVYPSRLMNVWMEGLVVALILFLIARPISVYASLLPFKSINGKEKALISWVGLRGAAPIVLATFPLSERVHGAEFIFNIVFFVVLLSVFIQGTTITPLARRLGLDANIETEEEHDAPDIMDDSTYQS
jgi:cell volume regulation protein A